MSGLAQIPLGDRTVNDIPQLQNEPEQIRLRRAAAATFDLARTVAVWQAILSVVVPVLGALATLVFPAARPWVAALSLSIVLVDAIGLDRWQKKLLKRGAKISERFDCRVLDLPADPFTTGPPPDPEDIRAAEKRYGKPKANAPLTDWYPVAVGQAPIHLARLICQRTNLSYDSRLRRSYAGLLRAVAVGAPLLLAAGTTFVTNQISDFLLLLAMVTPLISWCCREAYRQQDTVEAQENLMAQARQLWSDALANRCRDDHCAARAREFQSAIFARRATATPVLPGIYASRRARLEDEMESAAADFLAEYRAARVAKARA